MNEYICNYSRVLAHGYYMVMECYGRKPTKIEYSFYCNFFFFFFFYVQISHFPTFSKLKIHLRMEGFFSTLTDSKYSLHEFPYVG